MHLSPNQFRLAHVDRENAVGNSPPLEGCLCMTTEHKCGECAKFKVSDAGCPNYAYFHEYVDGRPLMDANATACSDFLEKGS